MKNFFPFLLLILLFPLLAACDRGPHLSPVSEQGVILAFGDSLTYGTGAEEGKSYPDVLETLLGRKVINGGVPGETSAQGVERLPEMLAEVQPDLVILLHGGNDMLQRMPADQLQANVSKMVTLSREAGAEVLLIGVPAPAAFMQTASLYNGIAADMNVLIDRHSLPDVLSKKEMRSENIHPNAEGYAALAEAIAKTIRKATRE